MANKGEITYPIKVDKELWKKFKNKIPRTENLNDVFVNIIKEKVNEE